jgi:hypothetical protein
MIEFSFTGNVLLLSAYGSADGADQAIVGVQRSASNGVSAPSAQHGFKCLCSRLWPSLRKQSRAEACQDMGSEAVAFLPEFSLPDQSCLVLALLWSIPVIRYGFSPSILYSVPFRTWIAFPLHDGDVHQHHDLPELASVSRLPSLVPN